MIGPAHAATGFGLAFLGNSHDVRSGRGRECGWFGREMKGGVRELAHGPLCRSPRIELVWRGSTLASAARGGGSRPPRRRPSRQHALGAAGAARRSGCAVEFDPAAHAQAQTGLAPAAQRAHGVRQAGSARSSACRDRRSTRGSRSRRARRGRAARISSSSSALPRNSAQLRRRSAGTKVTHSSSVSSPTSTWAGSRQRAHGTW